MRNDSVQNRLPGLLIRFPGNVAPVRICQQGNTVLLPDCFHCYRGDQTLGPRGEPANPPGSLRFGSFNNLPKITDRTVAVWSAILRQVPGSQMFIKTHGLDDPLARKILLGRFAANGISLERVRLMPRVESQEAHMRLYDQVDIALDTFPYNGTTTTCEALWMGVPVVTFAGDRHASRVGASLLHAVGLDELIGDLGAAGAEPVLLRDP